MVLAATDIILRRSCSKDAFEAVPEGPNMIIQLDGALTLSYLLMDTMKGVEYERFEI
jgi:hypothetical protein